MSESNSIEKPWSKEGDQLLEEINSDGNQGLSDKEAKEKLEEHGRNKLAEMKQKSVWEILWDQMKTPVVYLLAAAAVLSFVMGDFAEGIAIVVVLIINAAIGFWMEWQAQKSMKALKEMDKIMASVIRGGEEKEIDAEELVPGDIVVLGEGNLIPADMRLIEVSELQIDESALTGESVPV
ncbi:MAG TPA: HAD-IC family P-type ATPase, partial [Cryomorphaceae bacterium]|nr:HAD-IC family P-type ATPase [Cryomorphaceae bacterium]